MSYSLPSPSDFLLRINPLVTLDENYDATKKRALGGDKNGGVILKRRMRKRKRLQTERISIKTQSKIIKQRYFMV